MNSTKLSDVEMIIMHTIWKMGDNHTVYEVIDVISEDCGRRYSTSTVKTYLTKLKKKGFITTYIKGNYSYIVVVKDQEEYKREQIQKMKNFWYDGSSRAFFNTLTQTISKEEKEELKEILNDMDS